MSGAVTAVGVMAAASVATLGYSIYSGQQAADAQKKAQSQAEQNAQQQTQAIQQQTAAATQQARQSFNAANQKQPDAAAALSGVQQAAKGGQSSTMLTGPQGIDPNLLSLGKNTLLGM